MSAKKRRADGKAQTWSPKKRRTGKQQAARIAKVLAIVGVVGALVLAGFLAAGYAVLRTLLAPRTSRTLEQRKQCPVFV